MKICNMLTDNILSPDYTQCNCSNRLLLIASKIPQGTSRLLLGSTVSSWLDLAGLMEDLLLMLRMPLVSQLRVVS